METVSTRYARTADGDSIAYQVVGNGPIDLVYVPGFISNVETFWTEPRIARFYNRLASFSRLILFDKRGTGLSDPLSRPQPLEERVKDVGAVMDAVGSSSASIVGLSEGSAMAMVFAATFPERANALVLCGPIIGGTEEGHPVSASTRMAAEKFNVALESWGDGGTIRLVYPTSPFSNQRLGEFERSGASPRMARELIEMWMQIDLRGVFEAVSVPTLVLHHTDEIFPVAAAREIAERIPNARLVEVPGIDHVPWGQNSDQYEGEIEEFLTGVRRHVGITRRLTTLMMTDLVGSTVHAASAGDEAWQAMMALHDDIVRTRLRLFDGQEIKQTGDGFLASFDGPARAIRCACNLVRAIKGEAGLDVRVGVHTGEVEFVDSDVRGLGVHVAARVNALAGPGEVLVSSTVKELVLGSGIIFHERGTYTLKGVPDQWRLYAVVDDA